MANEFIFKKNEDGIEFVGDFDGLYANEDNPWEQSNEENSVLSKYYKSSRQTLVQNIKQLKVKNGCEIGCGLGYVTNMLHGVIEFDGIDISDVAIKKASKIFEDIDFFTADIGSSTFKHSKAYDLVILNQILWYILTNLDTVKENIETILNKDGFLIISTLFLKNQQYGTEIIANFDELVSYWIKDSKYRIINANINYGDEDPYQDSILVLQKIQS